MMTNKTDPRDESLRLILDLDLDKAEIDQLAQAFEQLRSDESLAGRLDGLLDVRQTLTGRPDMYEQDDSAAGFERKLIASLEQSPTAPPHRPAIVGRFITGFAGGLAAAAMVLIGLVGTGWWGQNTSAPINGTTEAIDTSTWLPDDPEQQRALLTQLAGFYDGRAGWYATTGRDVRMGLAEQPVNAYEPIVTRLSLETPDGRVISTDLALFPGQDVIVEAPRPDGSPVRYAIRVQPPDNGYHSTRLNLTVSVGDGPSMSTQLLLEGAAVREVGRLLTDQGEYQFRLGLAGSS